LKYKPKLRRDLASTQAAKAATKEVNTKTDRPNSSEPNLVTKPREPTHARKREGHQDKRFHHDQT
jgi:hypothetical protein